jgi:hypothetical protein
MALIVMYKSEESKIFQASYFISLDCLFNFICRNDGVPEFRKPEVGEVAEVQEEAPAGSVIYQVRGLEDKLEAERRLPLAQSSIRLEDRRTS